MWIWEDIKAKAEWCYGAVTWRTVAKTLLTDGTPSMVWYRLMQASRRCRIEPAAMLFNKLNAICCGCIIGRGAEFGPGFVLVHSHGVVINSAVRGGRNVFIEHQVTIGAEKNESPILGDDIFIGAGAKVVGAVRIGSEAKIGANAVVVRDVPEGATVGGIPARVLKLRGQSETKRPSPTSGPRAFRVVDDGDLDTEVESSIPPQDRHPLAIAIGSVEEEAE